MLVSQRVQPTNCSPSLYTCLARPDSGARALALRMYYIEVSNGMCPGDAVTANQNVLKHHLIRICSVVGNYRRGGL